MHSTCLLFFFLKLSVTLQEILLNSAVDRAGFNPTKYNKLKEVNKFDLFLFTPAAIVLSRSR